MANSGLVMHGYTKLRLLAREAGPEVKKDLDKRLREVAEPIRSDAEAFAASGIPRVGPKWSKMRIGVTRRVVYVAPKQRGVRTRGPDPRRRPRFADLLDARALTPALDRHKGDIEAAVDGALTEFALRWNRI